MLGIPCEHACVVIQFIGKMLLILLMMGSSFQANC